jgi:hypothetical protein
MISFGAGTGAAGEAAREAIGPGAASADAPCPDQSGRIRSLRELSLRAPSGAGIDNWAHLGGFAVAYVCSKVLDPLRP